MLLSFEDQNEPKVLLPDLPTHTALRLKRLVKTRPSLGMGISVGAPLEVQGQFDKKQFFYIFVFLFRISANGKIDTFLMGVYCGGDNE